MSNYAHPEALVTTQWVANHLNDSNVRIVESDEDVLLYKSGHIPRAIKIDWQLDLQDPVQRDYISREKFQQLLSEKGIANDSLVVFYGDKSNWWACYAFWTFKLYGHHNCMIMNGGRQKWVEEKRGLIQGTPSFPKTDYKVQFSNEKRIRAFREDVVGHIGNNNPLIDVRSGDEYSGKLLHMESYPQEGALRGGHIPGAKNVPWSMAVYGDGTFKSADDLKKIYEHDDGLNSSDNVIVYCRIGERSAHTWFVLTYLLGYTNVRNYDGSWTEWGNLVRARIEREV